MTHLPTKGLVSHMNQKVCMPRTYTSSVARTGYNSTEAYNVQLREKRMIPCPTMLLPPIVTLFASHLYRKYW